jgi:hypothetical protein
MVFYDCRWVEECINMGVKVPMGNYIVDPEWLNSAEGADGEGERQVEEEGSEVPETGMGVTTKESQVQTTITEKQQEEQDLNREPASIEVEVETGGKFEVGESENHLKFIDRLPKIYVDPTDFISKETLLKAVRHRPTPTPRSSSTITPRAKYKRDTSSNIKAQERSTIDFTSNKNAIAGPSRPRQPLYLAPLFNSVDNDNEHENDNEGFIPFPPTSTMSQSRFRHFDSNSSPSPTPLPIKLHIPYKNLDETKVSQFMRKFRGSVQCELDDVYLRALEGESGAWRIMGLEKA